MTTTLCSQYLVRVYLALSAGLAALQCKMLDSVILGGTTLWQARSQGGGARGAAAPRKKLNFRKNKPPSPLHGRLVTGLCL